MKPKLIGKATEKQIALLKKWGRRVPHNISKQKAHDLISEGLESRKARAFTGSISFGTGMTHYTHGVLDYVDDGNGNEWFMGDDDYDDYDEYD